MNKSRVYKINSYSLFSRMKVVDLTENQKVLLVRQDGIITAIGTKCSHYGAPLVNGALGDGRVRCPWHGACFNIKTGKNMLC
jgi:nitrite reductase/ring-hydroxylating ferredoxin subunit